MTTGQSALHGIRTSGDYFLSTFMFGVMFGMTAAAIGFDDWQAPLPLGTIALSVFLVSTRNLLLGMAMTHHFDGHSLGRRIAWLFMLNDPGVVNSFRQDENVDRLGYVTGYGLSMMASWLTSTWLGLNAAQLFANFDLGSVSFAGPLVLATMMMLFFKNSKTATTPWLVSGGSALILFELGLPDFAILLGSVFAGLVVAIVQVRKNA